ncbi:hypothetical protein K2X92_01225 [Candidatus Gracilibacteria bacterium]|nr:hypothetical protein [Candidatus Gracilibacteria bacterium]
MSSLLIFWISIGIGFLIIEMITVTFYGLAISMAAFLTGLYVWYFGLSEVNIMQGIIFAVVSFLSSYFFPKLLMPNIEEKAQGLDTYIGQTRKVKQVGEDFKVIFDGVEYLIDIDGVKSGTKVRLTSRKGSLFYGEIVN